MNELFLLFFSLSISGTFILLLLILLKPVYKNRLSKKWQYYIWIIVLIRLIIPIAPLNNIVGNLFEYADSYFNNKNSTAENKENLYNYNEYYENEYANNSEDLQLKSDNKSNTVNLNSIFLFIKNYIWVCWLFIFSMLLVQRIISYKNFIKFIKAGSLKLNNDIILDIYDDICSEMKIKNKPGIYINNIVVSPMLAGIFKPFIVIPKKDIEKQDIKYILIHELIHYKRKDIFYKWFVQLIVCIHWYNPLVYVLCNEINKNCELSCDEEIIKNFNIEQRKKYGDILLESILNNGNYSDSFVSITLNENEKLLKERLEAIMKFKGKKNIIISGISVILILITALVSGCIVLADSNKYQEVTGYFHSPNSYNRTYMSRLFFENQYIINIEWTNDDKEYIDKIYNNKIYIETNNKSFEVYFSKDTKNYINNDDIISAVKNILSEDYKSKFNYDYICINKISGPYNESAEKLGENFYQKKEIAYFSAVVKKANRNWKAEYAKKAYEDEEIAFFSILSDSLNEEENIEIANRAYRDRKIAFFSVIVDSLPEQERTKFAKKAYEDGEIAFFTVLSDDYNYYDNKNKYHNKSYVKESNIDISEWNNEKAKLAKKAYEDKEIAFFSNLSEYLSNEEKASLAKKAYEDKEIAFFSNLSEYLSNEEKANLAIKAYEDREIAFFSNLSEYLSEKQKLELLKRAYRDGEIAFFSVLSD